MKIIQVIQGSPEWLDSRRRYLCASEAPAMMGASKHTTRSELVRMKATGDAKEFSEWQQENLINAGHASEKAGRPFVEELLGDELYPVTGADDEGRFLASFDGINMAGDTGFEHKLWNEELATSIREGRNSFPGGHEWQLEHQLIVGGLARIIFVCSDGTRKRLVYTEYRPVKGRREQLLAGWKQFEADVADYKHVEVLPSPAGRVIKDLPALFVELEGEVKSTNLAVYRETALAFIQGIKTDLQTDQDFADADKTVKFCSDAEDKIKLVKSQALSKTASIADLFSTLDELGAAMRGKRLELEKLVEARKKSIRSEILSAGQSALAAHIATLNTRLGRPLMPEIPADFAGAMKGKKTLQSLRDAVDTELARAKIASNEIADRMGINLKVLHEACGDKDLAYLFQDLRLIVGKENDDFAMLVKSRVADERERVRKASEAAAAAATAAATTTAATSVASTTAIGTTAAKVIPLQTGSQRPGDDKIVAALCQHFNVAPDTVIAWLLDMDLPRNRVPATAKGA